MPADLPAFLARFRDDLNAAAPPPKFRSYFTAREPPVCLEHGPTGHADLPFLGEAFTGGDEIVRYYELIGSILEGKGSNFRQEDFVFKEVGGGRVKAIWTGDAVWSVAKTGREWHEAVVWLFEVAVEEEEWKIARWEVWAGAPDRVRCPCAVQTRADPALRNGHRHAERVPGEPVLKEPSVSTSGRHEPPDRGAAPTAGPQRVPRGPRPVTGVSLTSRQRARSRSNEAGSGR